MLTKILTSDERDTIINLVKNEKKFSAICFPATCGDIYELTDHALVRKRSDGNWSRLPRRLRIEIYSMFSY